MAGKNVSMKVTGTGAKKKLVIEIDLSKSYGRSKGGNGPNEIIASTGGNIDVPDTDDVKIGLNIYKPAS